ncbi:DUF2141 domain-containing protein [Acidovorax sp. FJL06]|uniref:DUF2141 domain-containing protein n=1 Tax=Acidovorax sp. FJL06 TaxID=2153365 RepID=UPI000F57BDA0|nr:DUF2141 domain-containing protein [Acidovorax sp. FJL06]RQO80252.1 hypothetical protein DBV10_20150 [Acidovorax sp. FJL06]
MQWTHTAFFLAMAGLPLAASAADLRVTVLDGPAVPATLYLALASQKAELRDGAAQLVFSGLPVGRYVTKSFADENGNARLDTNLLGLPTERYGFSNDARARMGPPSFDAAAVPLDAVDSSITIRLRWIPWRRVHAHASS